jgi:hypothetical protein
MFFSCTVFVLSGRGLCDGLIPRPEESYRLWCVSECDQVENKQPRHLLWTGRRGKDCETRRKKIWWRAQITKLPTKQFVQSTVRSSVPWTILLQTLTNSICAPFGDYSRR